MSAVSLFNYIIVLIIGFLVGNIANIIWRKYIGPHFIVTIESEKREDISSPAFGLIVHTLNRFLLLKIYNNGLTKAKCCKIYITIDDKEGELVFSCNSECKDISARNVHGEIVRTLNLRTVIQETDTSTSIVSQGLYIYSREVVCHDPNYYQYFEISEVEHKGYLSIECENYIAKFEFKLMYHRVNGKPQVTITKFKPVFDPFLYIFYRVPKAIIKKKYSLI